MIGEVLAKSPGKSTPRNMAARQINQLRKVSNVQTLSVHCSGFLASSLAAQAATDYAPPPPPPLMLASLKQKIKYRLFRRRALMHLKKMGYLVSSVPPMSVPYTQSEFEKLDRSILDKIRFLQFNSSAENLRFLIVAPTKGSGAGSSLLAMTTKGLKLGYLYNRTVLYDNSDLVYDFCFKPIGSHSLQEMGLETEKQAHFNFLRQKEKVVRFEARKSMEWGIETETALIMKYGVRLSEINYVAPLTRLPYSDVYIDGLLMDSFLELREEYKEHIENRKREMGLESPIIGLHIRQGDVTKIKTASFRRHPIGNFLEAAEEIASKANIKTVFVTTDSEKAIRQLPKDSGITFIYDDQEQRYDNFNARMVRENQKLKKQETMTAIKNIYLLGDCNYIVGVYSHFLRYGMALSYYRNKKLNGILMRKKERSGFSLEYLVTDDDKLQGSESPVEPYIPSKSEMGDVPWLR